MAGTGFAVQYMTQTLQWEVLKVYRTVFWAYAGLGSLMLLFTLPLSSATEAEPRKQIVAGVQSANEDPETAPLLPDIPGQVLLPESKEIKSNWRSKLPQISKESRVLY
jgi:hypothetical protein